MLTAMEHLGLWVLDLRRRRMRAVRLCSTTSSLCSGGCLRGVLWGVGYESRSGAGVTLEAWGRQCAQAETTHRYSPLPLTPDCLTTHLRYSTCEIEEYFPPRCACHQPMPAP